VKNYLQHAIETQAAPEADWLMDEGNPVDQIEPERTGESRASEVLRSLADVWLEEPDAWRAVMDYIGAMWGSDSVGSEVLMMRVLFPSAPWAEAPALMSKDVTRQACHKAAKKLALERPELDPILFPPRAGSVAQRDRRDREGKA